MAVKAMKAKAIDFLTKPVREQLLRRQRLLQPLSWHLLLRQQRNRLHHRQSLQRHLQPQSLRRSKSL
jgi:FixJ family two-component response regulator